MNIALVGEDAPALCRIAGVDASAFVLPADAAGRRWDLLALTRTAAAARPFPEGLVTRTLLLPGDESDPARAVRACQVIGYGFSPRDTLTLSSFTGAEPLLCVQRSVLTLRCSLIEPQELPLSPALHGLSAEQALLLSGLRLLAAEGGYFAAR